MLTIQDVIDSLERRGFVPVPNWFDPRGVQTQIDAVLEELGEVARILRRVRQGRQEMPVNDLREETADVVISAICLHALACGDAADGVIRVKLAADEKKLWLHSGETREQYEASHGRA